MPERLPKNSCDAHLHVFGDVKDYPVANPNALYQPPQDCNFAAVAALHDAMGVDRAVFVQPTIYGTDHSLLHDVLKAAPKGKYRGVAIVDDGVSDAELARLHGVGVRGARFNFGGNFKLAPSVESLRRTLSRVFHQSPVSGDEHPPLRRSPQQIDPFDIGGMPPSRKARNVLDMEGSVAFMLDEAI